MRTKTGRTWQDHGPGSSQHGITGHHSALSIALEVRSPTGMVGSSVMGRCPVCGDKTDPGKFACSVEHQKIAYGNRGFSVTT